MYNAVEVVRGPGKITIPLQLVQAESFTLGGAAEPTPGARLWWPVGIRPFS